MSKQASKSLIGAFVVGAIVLAVIGILIFGSGKFFAERAKYVLYFKGSVKGLSIGAPVVFRGVKVGTVTDIQLHFDTRDMSVRIPVVIEVEPEKLRRVRDKEVRKYQYLKPLIERGLRGQLTLQSMVTGQLMVNFDFFPEKPVVLSGLEHEYPEIPTIPSEFDEILKTIEELPIKVLVDKLVSTVEGIEELVTAPETRESITNLNETLKSAKKVLDDIDIEIEPLVANIEETSDAARAAFVQAEKTLALEEGVPGELAISIKDTLASTRNALDKAEEAFSSAQDVISDDSPIVYQLNETLKELSAAARSLRTLVDLLGQHPESVIKGKERRKGVLK